MASGKLPSVAGVHLMSKMRDRKWRLLQLLVERLPPFVSHYEGTHQQYVADFIDVLQHVDVHVPSTRTQFAETAATYLEKYCTQTTGFWHSEYQILPFLWFTCDFLRATIDSLQLKDNFHHFLQLCYGLLHGAEGTESVFSFLSRGLVLTENNWEKLQFQTFDLQRPLNSDELAMVRLLFRVLPDLKYTSISIPTIEGLFRQHGASTRQIQSVADFSKQQGLYFDLLVNWPRLGVEEFELTLKTPADTDFKDILDFSNPANSILTESRIYTPWQPSKSEKTFVGLLRIPSGHEHALHTFLMEKQENGIITSFRIEKVLEMIKTFSLTTYVPNEGFQRFTTQEIWQILGGLMDGKGKPAQSLDEVSPDPNFFILRYVPGNQINLTHEFAHLRESAVKPIDLAHSPPSFPARDQTLLNSLQQKKVLILSLRLSNLVKAVGLSPFQYLQLPNLPATQLKSLLSFALESYIRRTVHGVNVFTHVPSPVAKVFHTPGWAPSRRSGIFEVVMAHRPSWVNPRCLNAINQQWDTPIELQDYMEKS
jgi:hypothetical protein